MEILKYFKKKYFKISYNSKRASNISASHQPQNELMPYRKYKYSSSFEDLKPIARFLYLWQNPTAVQTKWVNGKRECIFKCPPFLQRFQKGDMLDAKNGRCILVAVEWMDNGGDGG